MPVCVNCRKEIAEGEKWDYIYNPRKGTLEPTHQECPQAGREK